MGGEKSGAFRVEIFPLYKNSPLQLFYTLIIEREKTHIHFADHSERRDERESFVARE